MDHENFDVFISYNSKDRQYASHLVEELRVVGLNVWIDYEQLRPGQSWQTELSVAINKSRSVLVLIGSSGIGPWQDPEVKSALDKFMKSGNPIVPVILPNVRKKPVLPPFLEQNTWVDLRGHIISQLNFNKIIWGITGQKLTTSISQMGDEFVVSRSGDDSDATSIIRLYTLPNTKKESLLFLTWETFGRGIEVLLHQLQNLGTRLGIDACFGINDAGLVMATFISSHYFDRSSLGYIKCGKVGNDIKILEDSLFPNLGPAPTIMLFDFEIKRANVLGKIIEELNSKYLNPVFYFSVFGAMTESLDLKIGSLNELSASKFLSTLGIKEIFIACTMHPPGIEPPLFLR